MESLRVLTPVPMTLRKAGKDDWIDGYFIPKGTVLYIPVWGLSSSRIFLFNRFIEPCSKYLYWDLGARCRGVRHLNLVLVFILNIRLLPCASDFVLNAGLTYHPPTIPSYRYSHSVLVHTAALDEIWLSWKWRPWLRMYQLPSQKRNLKLTVAFYRVLIAHFSFEPAYEGQVPKPMGARSMSTFF